MKFKSLNAGLLPHRYIHVTKAKNEGCVFS